MVEGGRAEGGQGYEEGVGVRGGADFQVPTSLFETYARSRGIPADMREAGLRLLREHAGPGVGGMRSHVAVSLDSVELEGFGSFARLTNYSFRQRGLVLLQGATQGMADGGFGRARRREGLAGFGGEGGTGDGGEAGGAGAGGGAEAFQLDEGLSVGGSNGAGKTTLAMAPLWCLTGSTDERASGKPVELRGVIHDSCKRARVSICGRVWQVKPRPPLACSVRAGSPASA
eukprot:5829220-Pleurochrysis_carterae.AAC.1